ncbi:MAG: Arc family DNA-binding protein [Microscillaceae bacterium]|nr:Arc family DNA-binding protein [Microscillaceae bacterium]
MAKEGKEDAKRFVLRLRPETMEAVEKWAADEFRSINGQLEWIIYNALRDAGRLKKSQSPQKSDSTPPEAETSD